MLDTKNTELAKYSKEVQESFCILPFFHTFLNTEGDVFPCCISWDGERTSLLGYIKDNSLEELFNSEKLKQLRLDFINGKRRPDICTRCYTSEDNGFPAARHGNNWDFKHLIDELIEAVEPDGYMEPKIKSWDIRYSNLCNLKCRSCGSVYSTTWSKEDEDFGEGEYQEIKAYPDGKDPLAEQYDHVEKIYFAGGEPLIMPEHYATLNEIISRGRAKEVRLVYNTNMTKLNYNKNNLVDLWSKFSRVTLGLSIDGVKERADYIRHGNVKWNKIEKNIKQICEYSKANDSNMDYFFSPTVSLLNVYTLTDMHRYFYENEMMLSIDNILFNILYHPNELSLTILPEKIKKEVQYKIENHIIWMKENGAQPHSVDQFKSLIEYLNESNPDKEKHIRTFVTRTIQLDKRRDESFPDTFPEYAEWWEEISKNTIMAVNI